MFQSLFRKEIQSCMGKVSKKRLYFKKHAFTQMNRYSQNCYVHRNPEFLQKKKFCKETMKKFHAKTLKKN